MKKIILLFLAAWPLFAIAQREIAVDSTRFFTAKNECDSLVWWGERTIILKGGAKFTESSPVAFDEKNPCENIKAKDTTTLLNYFSNSFITDKGRQLAQQAEAFIFINQQLKGINALNASIVRSGLPDLFKYLETSFADSLIGTYRLRVTADKATTTDCTIQRRPNGQVVIRSGTTNYPLKFFGDDMLEVTNLPSTGDKTLIFKVAKNKGRWSSFDRKVQVLKSDKFAIESLK